MNLCNYFSVGNSGWTNDYLLERAKNLPNFRLELDSTFLKNKIHWKIDNIGDYITHYNRMMNSNLTCPIILRSDAVVMDGYHRLIKALLENRSYLLAKKFLIDPPPNATLVEVNA